MPASHVINCPHCSHPVNLPEDYLGRIVSCLQCLAPFRAPVREGDGLTAPVALAKSRGVPVRMFIPLFGLMLLGVAGLAINGFLLSDPKAAANVTRSTVDNLFSNEPPEKKEWTVADKIKRPDDVELRRREQIMEAFARDRQRGVEDMAAAWPDSKPYRVAGLVASALTMLGGLAFLTRRGYPLAFIGCVAAMLNSPDLGCCFAGVLVAGWGFMALISDEGRRYFRKEVPTA